jgi:hypothetical protein
MICPECLVERADYEGPSGKWLPRCPNCGSLKDPVEFENYRRRLTVTLIYQIALIIALIFLVAALFMTLWSATTGKCPLWVPVLLMIITFLLIHLPVKLRMK